MIERPIYGVFIEVAVGIKISTFSLMPYFHNMIPQNENACLTKNGDALLIRNSTGPL